MTKIKEGRDMALVVEMFQKIGFNEKVYMFHGHFYSGHKNYVF